MLFDRRTLAIHVWIRSVFLTFPLFFFGENETFRFHFKHEGICRKTLYLHKLLLPVKSRIKAALPDQVVMVFDGSSSGSTQFITILSTLPSYNRVGYDQVYRQFLILNNKSSLDAADRVDLLKIFHSSSAIRKRA